MVTEENDFGHVINQPAGHWENNETLIEAVVRETLEETTYSFIPKGLVGCYHWKLPDKDKTYLRFCFHGDVTGFDSSRPLDVGIVSADWLSLDELQRDSCRKRSPLVLTCINDYLNGKRYPLEMLNFIVN